MKCPYCGQEHPDDFMFCPISGQPLKSQTKVCGNPACKYSNVPIEAKFCPRCGTPFPAKKQCTVNRQHNAHQSQIVIVCSKAGSYIQIGQWLDDKVGREKRISLKKGENTISVEDYSELRYGFSFNKDTDKPEYIECIILDKFDTSDVTNMRCMFSGCSSLEALDLSNFDTSNVTDMGAMFWYCSSLKTLDLSCFNTSNVTNMCFMFSYCDSLKTLDLSRFDTSNVTNMCLMFSYCSSLKFLDLSRFNTSNVTDMSAMFWYCSSLKALDLSNFDTSNVTSMRLMFSECRSLEALDLSRFDTSNVIDMSEMFWNCSKEIQKEYQYLHI
ncbi:BspA family leucine-rich repeat surface protein [uncultured Bacteroides sp.]|uniref:BspA family leucine-rich repeat surface protein n=1 Tax=uncultured Bacteroides sp. TaxID=162156 RepID=UPI0025FE8388|nr:BspA family leucine-rich repeat surface protein [uncultured Bacteroides sp.]